MAHAEIDQEPSFDRVQTEYKIYVNCLPPELNEVAIREVFSQYGVITGMFYPHKATWAYITYKSFREAERAIRELNDKKPLYLKVALAKERSVIKEEELQKPNISNPYEGKPRARDAIAETLVSTRNDVKYQKGVGRGQILNFYKHLPQNSMSDILAEKGSSTCSLPSQGSNVYEMDEEYLNTNKLWSRGVITVTPDGRRHVTLGRGYTLYDFPEREPKLEEYIAKVYEKRQNGLYEYGEDELKIHYCIICATKTTKHCERCNTYYCSTACQKKDWPRHKVECERIPRLVEEINNDVTLLQINKDENQTKTSKLNLTSKTIASEVKLRRPNASSVMQAENSNSINTNTNMYKNADRNSSLDNDINNRNIHLSTRHDNNTNTSCIKTADQPVLNATNTKDFSRQNQSPRYNNTKEDTEKSRSDEHSSTTSNYTNQNRSRHNGAIKKTSSNQERCDNNSNLRDRNYNSERSQSYQRNESQNDQKSMTCNRENVNRQGSNASNNNIAMNNDVTFDKDMYLSKTEFVEVEITLPLSNDEYWIYKVKDSEMRTNLMVELQDIAKRLRNVQPIVNNIYAVLYETVWQRAMIISLNPLTVNFIDYGNNEILQKDIEIKDLPENMTKVPHFARKIRLSSATGEKYKNFKYGERIFVKMLSMDAEKTIIVDVREQSKNVSSHMESSSIMNDVEEKFVQLENLEASNKSLKVSLIEIPSILDILINLLTQKAVSEELVGFLQIHESVQENRYSATLCPLMSTYSEQFEMVYNSLDKEYTMIQESTHYKSEVNELIWGEAKEGWYRGYVKSSTSSGLQIVSIDEARILPVNKIVPCPKKFLDICAFGIICEVNHPNKLNVAEIYQFTAAMNEQNSKQENLIVKLIKDSKFVCEAVIKSWKFIIQDPKPIPAFSEIKSGSKICIVSYRSHKDVFVRSLDEEAIEYYNNIMQRVAQCALTAPLLNEPPISKQSVIAPFTDGNSYRAMVVKTQNDIAHVVYTDFGNVYTVNIKELRVLPENLALQRSCSARISLKDVPSNVCMNDEVDFFLRKLAGEETPLTCVYDGDSFKDGVYLTTSTKESVNDMINKLLIPTWKRDNHDDNTCYMLNHVEVASLGHVGMTTSALVLHVLEEGGSKYYMSPHDITLYAYINEKMPPLLIDYCEKTEYYIPRKSELCIALYQNMWYRAVCLNPKESYTTAQVFYIDYGNVESVEHKNIRLMPQDFLKPPAMANMCTVVNLAPVDNTGNYSPAIKQRLAELIPKNNESIVKIKIVEVISQECGQYAVELVEIKQKLIEEGLIPPS